MILVIDNYDSFTYNLAQYLGETGTDVLTKRNDRVTVEEIGTLRPSGIVLSPGPGTPADSGICREVITAFYKSIPILGVCLGHQTIAEVFGGTIERCGALFHGKTSRIFHDSRSIFTHVENPFTATRYHSLQVRRDDLPECLTVTAEADDGTVMGVRHKQYPVEGVQFHPESILTREGRKILLNFLNLKN